jgi:hypothetical protein
MQHFKGASIMKDDPKNGTVPLTGNPLVSPHKRMAAGEKIDGKSLPAAPAGKKTPA